MSDIKRQQFVLRFPPHLLADVDARAGALGLSRNEWFENMVRWALAHTTTKEQP